MAKRNVLIEGVTCSGKSSVGKELRKRGYSVVDGDEELAYQGDPETGQPTEGFGHEHHIWDLEKLNQDLTDESKDVTFFCGGSRNYHKFIHKMDEVFILDLSQEELEHRLDARGSDEWGGNSEERELVLRLNRTKEDIPEDGIRIDAAQPLPEVVDSILSKLQS
jgi:shikimate kinase